MTKGDGKTVIKYYCTENGKIHSLEEHCQGSWIMAVSPTYEESVTLSNSYGVDIVDIRAALDDEESSRVENSNGYTLIIVDIPTIETVHERENYTTIPLGIIVKEDVIITVCSEDTPVLQHFVKHNVREFSTKKQMRFVYQILLKTCQVYQNNLRVIDKKRTEIEERTSKEDTMDDDLVAVHELEVALVYFATSLRANSTVIGKLAKGRVRQYPEDAEILEDVEVENTQAIEMTGIYKDILMGTRELLSSISSNRLNMVMKYLAAITIVMSIPNIVSGLYGMNLEREWMPFAEVAYGFEILCLIILVACLITLIILRKRKML